MTNSFSNYILFLLVIHIVFFLVGCFAIGCFLAVANYGAAIIVALIMVAGFIYSKLKVW